MRAAYRKRYVSAIIDENNNFVRSNDTFRACCYIFRFDRFPGIAEWSSRIGFKVIQRNRKHRAGGQLRILPARNKKDGGNGKAADTFIRTDVAVAPTRSGVDPLCMPLSNLFCFRARSSVILSAAQSSPLIRSDACSYLTFDVLRSIRLANLYFPCG